MSLIVILGAAAIGAGVLIWIERHNPTERQDLDDQW